MSTWAHVLGLIYYDYWAMSTHPRPADASMERACEYIYREAQNRAIPCGSEGGLSLDICKGSRGPILVFSGDLRDYENEAEILKFVKSMCDLPENWNKKHNNVAQCVDVRNLCVSVHVEFKDYIIVYDYDHKKGLTTVREKDVLLQE